MENNKVIEVIKPDAIIEIKMSTGYYQNIQMIIKYLIGDKTEIDIKSAHEQITNKNITEDWVKHYETLLVLCKEFESQAKITNQVMNLTKKELEKIIKDNPDLI